ncbi:MAG TPA: glycerol kinase GlpK [Vicinamibacteria bacterium]|nr:glycerol kinase GlpK [Vicinamibacteria bacterium]
MVTPVVAALDQGTTSTRCLFFDPSGRVVASHQLEHRQIYPAPGWVEHDPEEIWQRACDCIRGAIARAGIDTVRIAALGITNQRETTILWDRTTGRPVANAIVWQDTRTDSICDRLAREEGPDRFRAKTGLPLSTYFSGPKIRWLLDRDEGLREAASRGEVLFGNVDSWLIWNLTGGPDGGAHVTDVTNASRTMLFDLDSLSWDEEILEALDIPPAMLPRVRPSSDPAFYGMTREDGPFGGSIPVCGDLGDQQAALCGQACFGRGEAKNTYGTGCFLLLNTGSDPLASSSGLLTTVAYRMADAPAVYALEGSVAIAGALVQWLRDNLGILSSASEVERLAGSVEDNGGMFFVPAFSGLFAPHWRSDARGVMVGLTRYINKGHIARASLEATAFQTKEVLEAMKRDSGFEISSLKVDGGMVVNELLMQFQADLLGVPVIRPRVSETTSLGAAYAAGLAVGFWKDEDELRRHWAMDKKWSPRMDEAERNRLTARWQMAVERALGWV